MKQQRKTSVTGVSLTPDRYDKLGRLAQILGISKNATISLLIDAAQEAHPPTITFGEQTQTESVTPEEGEKVLA